MDGKEIDWRGSSYKDLLAMPEKVRKKFGHALRMAQNGLRDEDTKQLAGFKPALIEILEDDDGDTYRAILHRAFRGPDLRPPLLQKEIDEGAQPAKSRQGND